MSYDCSKILYVRVYSPLPTLYRGALSVIDWKTSSKPKPTLSDCFTYPLQAAAYAGAINQDPHYPSQVSKRKCAEYI